MTTNTLRHLLKEMTVLTPEERRQLRDAIDLSFGGSTLEDEVERALLSAGLLSELRLAPDQAAAYRECEPIAVDGQPLSETIIEDRR